MEGQLVFLILERRFASSYLLTVEYILIVLITRIIQSDIGIFWLQPLARDFDVSPQMYWRHTFQLSFVC